MAVVEICGVHFFFKTKHVLSSLLHFYFLKLFWGGFFFAYSNEEIDRVTDLNDAKETTTQIFLDKN